MFDLEIAQKNKQTVSNTPFPSCLLPLYQNETLCETIHMKMIFAYGFTLEHSRLQSLRSFWPAAGIESSGSNHYERTKEITEFWLSGSLRICIYGACLKWLLPELSIPAAGQKDRRLWSRE